MGSLEVSRLGVKCTGSRNVDYRTLLDLQGPLKVTSEEKIKRLAESLSRFGLVNPLQVWEAPDGGVYCFDAHHRKKALAMLEFEGMVIPELPAVECLAPDRKTAKTLLLVKESLYSWIDISQVPDYLEGIGLSVDVAAGYFEIPIEVAIDTGNFVEGDVEYEPDVFKYTLKVAARDRKDIEMKLAELKVMFPSLFFNRG